MSYNNPPEELSLRDYYPEKSESYDQMMESIYYCGTHHSLETKSTHNNHKNKYSTYTRGMILGKHYFDFLTYNLGADKNDTTKKFIGLARKHNHVDDKKIRALLFTKYLDLAKKFQNTKSSNEETKKNEIEEEKKIEIIPNSMHQENVRLNNRSTSPMEIQSYEVQLQSHLFHHQIPNQIIQAPSPNYP